MLPLASAATVVLGTLFTPCGCPAISSDPLLSPCLPLLMRCPLLPTLPQPQLSPALPSVPGRADCYSSCIPSSQASGFLKKPRVLFPHTLPLARLVAQPCPCCAVPGPVSARSLGTVSAGEGTEPCQRSAPPCHRFPVSVRLAFSISSRSLFGEQSIPGCLSECWQDVAVPAVPHKQSLVTTRGRALRSCGDAKPNTALGSPIPVCLEHPCKDRELWAGKGRCDQGRSLAVSTDVLAQISA